MRKYLLNPPFADSFIRAARGKLQIKEKLFVRGIYVRVTREIQ